jgi:predicted Ser/Thr protein kinase
MVDRVGTEIAGYRIEGLIGRGGMSVVYLAEHVRLGRKVALKLLSAELAENEKFRERFLRESQIAASIDHPNIVPIYDADEAEGTLFIAMRYVEGTDLGAAIRSQAPLEPARVVSLVSQIAGALDAAHVHGLVHRDVKPGNVLLTREDHVYVADFGLTKRALSVSGLTETGQLVGTIDYIAPEQAKGDPVDGRADVYSLGCLAYECLTGEVPFERDTEVAVLWAHVQESPPKLSATHPELPTRVDGVIARAMAKKPDDRYPTAGELAGDLGRALDVTGGEHALLEPSEMPRRRRRRGLIAAGGAVALALAVGLVLATKDGPPPTVPPATPIGVVRIDVTSSRVTLSARDVRAGWDLVAAEGALWETGPDGLVKRNERTGEVEKVFDIGSETNVLKAGFGAIWVTVSVPPDKVHLVRVDPATDEIVETVDVSPSPTGGNGINWVAIDRQSVWVLTGEGTLWQIDPITHRIAQRYDKITAPDSHMTVGGGFVWLSNTLTDAITRLDPSTGKTDTILISSKPDQLAFVGGTLWTLDRDGRTVTPIDASLLEAGTPVGTPSHPTLMAGGLGWLWIPADGVVARISLATGQVQEIPVDFWASAVAPDEPTGTVWVLRQNDI